MKTQEGAGWIDELVGALYDPIIVYPSPWQTDIPDWVFPQIKMERLLMNMKVMKGMAKVPVGDTEVLAYMYPRTLEAPLDHQWCEIYMHVFTGAMKMKGTEIPDDIRKESLSDYDMRQLDELRGWIYARRVKARKEKERAHRREEKEAAKEVPQPTDMFTVIPDKQPSFF